MIGNGGQSVPADALENLAYSTYLTRKIRYELISSDLLGEPAWDILLLLFAHANRAQQLTFEELARELELGLPLTERWLCVLEEHGLVTTQANLAELSEQGRTKLKAYLRRQIAALTALLREAPPLRIVGSNEGGSAQG